MFDSRRRPERDDRIPLAVTSTLCSHGVTPSEYPFLGLSTDAITGIAKQIREKCDLPLTTLELSPHRSLAFFINILRGRARKIRSEKDLEKLHSRGIRGLKVGAMIGDFQVNGFFGHSGLTAVYQAREINTGEVGLVAVPLETSRPSRIEQCVPRGFYSHLPATGVVSRIVSSSSLDAVVEAELPTVKKVLDLERQRYQDECRAVSNFYLGFDSGDFRAIVFRPGEVFSLRHHMQLNMSYSLGAFVDLTLACEQMNGHGNLSPESVLLADGQLRAVLNPSVQLFDGHFFTSNWQYNPFRKRGVAADVVAIGVMLYESYAGERPFGRPFSANSRDIYDLAVNEYTSFSRPSTFEPLMKPELDQLIMRSILDRSYGIKDLRKGLEDYISRYGQESRAG